MSGYRCVNYFELCRLCTSSAGTKTQIFSEEGRKQDIIGKIAVCLPVVIDEQDKLPKILCSNCLNQIEAIAKFRETCIAAQAMLESCLNTSKLRNGGKVYIKDVSSKRLISHAGNTQTLSTPVKTIGTTTIRQVVSSSSQNTSTPATTSTTSSDFLSNIIQAVGIQNVDDDKPIVQQQMSSPPQQYTITLDGHNLKNQIHYKIEPANAVTLQSVNTVTSNTNNGMDEFLKIKSPTNKIVTKKKILGNRLAVQNKPVKGNVVYRKPVSSTQSSPTQSKVVKQQQHTTKILSPNTTSYPITCKEVSGGDQQIITQYNTKNVVLPANYIKFPQITTLNGQQIVQLSQKNVSGSTVQTIGGTKQTTQNIGTNQIIAVSGGSIIQSPSNETKTMFTTSSGQNVTITHQPLSNINNSSHILTSPQPMQLIQIHQPNLTSPSDNNGLIQLTTLQNVQAPLPPQPLPSKSGITIQRVKTEQRKAVTTLTTANKSTLKTQTKGLPTFRTPTGNAPKTKSKFISSTKTGSAIKSTIKTPIKTINKPPPQLIKITGKADGPTDESAANSPSCSVCDKVFKRKEHLAQHMKLHLGLRPFKCEEMGCNKSFSRKEHLMRHVVSHTGKKMFTCEYCHKLFSRKDNLNKHKRSHEAKAEQPGTVVQVQRDSKDEFEIII